MLKSFMETPGILGQASYDNNGDGYDVITSAKLVNWAGHGDKQIYYDGDHTTSPTAAMFWIAMPAPILLPPLA